MLAECSSDIVGLSEINKYKEFSVTSKLHGYIEDIGHALMIHNTLFSFL